jgi:hypothetical protein
MPKEEFNIKLKKPHHSKGAMRLSVIVKGYFA